MRKDPIPGIVLALILLTFSAGAAVLEVTHSPATGQYDSINAAIAAAANGDIIRIIDNSAPYEETVLIDTPGANEMLTIEGDPSLDPRPTIIGQGGTDVGGAIVTLSFGANYPDGCVIRNLILRSIDLNGDGPEAWSTICMMRFNFNAVFENVEFDAGSPANLDSALDQFWFGDNTFTDCTFKGGATGTIISMGGVSTFNHCSILPNPGGVAMNLAASEADTTLSFNDCYIAHQDTFGITTFDLWNANQLTVNLYRCLIQTTVTGNGDIVTIAPGSTSASDPIFNIDNCDFVKGAGSTGIIRNFLYYRGAVLNLTDTIFSGTNPGVAVWDPWGVAGVVFNDDYVIYHDCEFGAVGGSLVQGSNTTVLAASDPLYANPAAGDYRLLNTSVAATYSSGNSPETWAGSQGLEPSEYLITVDPAGVLQAGMTVTLTAPEGSDYSWEKGGLPLVEEPPRVTGVTSRVLILDPIDEIDAGEYICYFNDGVIDTQTEPLSLTVTPEPVAQVPLTGMIGLVLCAALLVLLAVRTLKTS